LGEKVADFRTKTGKEQSDPGKVLLF